MDLTPIAFGKYILLERISRGGMAEIFKAKAFGPDRNIFAVKRILPRMATDEHFIRMFIDEAKICGQLRHSNICQTYALGRVGETYFIAMEYVSGVDLFRLLSRLQPRKAGLPPEMVAHIGREICRGLDHAHTKTDAAGRPLGIIHRDISPQNILVGYDGALKIIDFGIAKAEDRSVHTQVGVVKGKRGYMSPEQTRSRPIDHRSDLFSVGVVMHELATGRRLFGARNDIELLAQLSNPAPPPPSRSNPFVPAELDRLILRALSQDPALRVQSAAEMAAALDAFLARSGSQISTQTLGDLVRLHFSDELAREQALLAAQAKIVDAADHIASPDDDVPSTGVFQSPFDTMPTDSEPEEETAIALDPFLESSMVVSIDRAPRTDSATPNSRRSPAPANAPATPHHGEVVFRPAPPRTPTRDVIAATALCVAVMVAVWSGRARAPAPFPGALVITGASEPSPLLIDGRPRGSVSAGAALSLKDLTPGVHEVIVRRPAGDYAQQVTIVPGEISLVAVPAAPAAPSTQVATGALRLELSGDGVSTADVFVDGAMVAEGAPILLRAGVPHDIRVERQGKVEKTFSVTVGAGETLIREVRLVAATKRRAARPVAGDPAPPEPSVASGGSTQTSAVGPGASGFLTANTQPFARVWIDGVDTGRWTPIPARDKIPLAPGAHRITFVAEGARHNYEIQVGSGELVSLTRRLSDAF